MSARLLPLKSATAPTILVQRPVLLVGRHPECDVRIDLPKISRRHCCVALAYDRVVIRDLGSRNGLRVNGQLIDEALLIHGDEVAIGPLIFRVDDPESAPREVLAVAAPLPPQPATEAPQTSRPQTALPITSLDRSDRDNELIPLDF